MTPGPGHRQCTPYLWPGPGGAPLALPLTEGLGSTVDDRLHAMTIWIDHEASIVVGAIVRPWPRATVVFASVQKRLLVELVHCVSIWRGECEVETVTCAR